MSAESLMSPDESPAQKSPRIGREYATHVANTLEGIGFTVIERNARHISGIEMDLLCSTPDGRMLAIECKGSDETARTPGMVRTDNYWKVLGYVNEIVTWRAYGDLAQDIRYVLVTSHLPAPNTPWGRGLNQQVLLGNLSIVCIPFPTKELP